jgi:hypothetical protein
MTVDFEVNEIRNQPAKRWVETVIRGALAGRPEEENWKFWIYSPGSTPLGYWIVVQNGSERRDRRLFQSTKSLVEAISHCPKACSECPSCLLVSEPVRHGGLDLPDIGTPPRTVTGD